MKVKFPLLLFTIASIICTLRLGRTQGFIYFNNRVFSDGPGPYAPVVAPIYGVEPTDPTLSITGQPLEGMPPGTTVYHGNLLAGTGFTVQLWGGPVGSAEDALQLCTRGAGFASTTFLTGPGAGFLFPVAGGEARVPGVGSLPGSRATLQVRAWDNEGGTITSWDQVLANAETVPHGASPLFTPDFDLGTPTGLWPNLIGLQSFNLYVVPEPSVVALALAGGTVLLCWRRRRRK